jgi:hypothetical protein
MRKALLIVPVLFVLFAGCGDDPNVICRGHKGVLSVDSMGGRVVCGDHVARPFNDT